MVEGHVRVEGAIGEVLDALGKFREASGFGGRARIAVQASRAMAALTPAQRRQLAVDVAKQAAPHLVDRIEGESDLDLTPAQVRAVIEMIGNMDGDDIATLRGSVQDPDWQRRAAERVMGTADDATEIDDEPPRPIAPVEPPDGPREPPQPQVTPTRYDEYEIGLPEMADWRAAGLDDSAFLFTRRTPPASAAARTSAVDRESVEQSWFGGGSLGVQPVVPARTALGDRLQGVEGSREQLRVILAAAHEFAGLPPGEQASALRQLRATWVRRRAVLTLIERGLLAAESARAVVGTFDSLVNRAWVVASLVEAGIGTVDDWADLLTPAAAERLARRYAA
ncbi:MAG TPA: hypothetical protein VGA36_04425 [Nitriliruptorales bacterium]